jgi:hypothetical protein
MKSATNTLLVDSLTFLGSLSAIGVLVGCLWVDDLRVLAVPALLVLLPSLIYELR